MIISNKLSPTSGSVANISSLVCGSILAPMIGEALPTFPVSDIIMPPFRLKFVKLITSFILTRKFNMDVCFADTYFTSLTILIFN